jgi:FtsP/CotA-like multicopper oxidase with cupredoxin domain
LIIHGPRNAKYDIDLGPVLLTDYWHIDYFYMVQRTLQGIPVPVLPPFAVNNLINGKMNFNCSLVDPGDNSTCKNNAGISKFKFQTGKTHRLRLINAGAEGLQRFSIDGHQLTVIANDFVPVVSHSNSTVRHL